MGRPRISRQRKQGKNLKKNGILWIFPFNSLQRHSTIPLNLIIDEMAAVVDEHSLGELPRISITGRIEEGRALLIFLWEGDAHEDHVHLMAPFQVVVARWGGQLCTDQVFYQQVINEEFRKLYERRIRPFPNNAKVDIGLGSNFWFLDTLYN